MNYLTQNDEDEDLIDGILGPSAVGVITRPATATPKNFSALLDEMDEPKPVTTPHFDDLGPIPVAAYPMADPFSPSTKLTPKFHSIQSPNPTTNQQMKWITQM